MRLAEAVAVCTNLRRRLRLMGAANDHRWAGFLKTLNGCHDHASALRAAMQALGETAPASPSPFGCFSYDPPDRDGVVRLHFMPEARHRVTSPLDDGALVDRRRELRALIDDVQIRYGPSATEFRGQSWLYHSAAYRRIFPGAYLARLTPASAGLHLNGSSIWGQVLDHRQQVRPGMSDRLLSALAPSIVATPWKAFPLQPLTTCCPAEELFQRAAE